MVSNIDDIHDILNAKDKSKSETNLTEGDQPKEVSNISIVHDDMVAKSINLHKAQGGRSDLKQSHSVANDSVMPSTKTIPDKTYDVVTLPDTSNNVQIFDEFEVSSRGRI